MRAVGGVGAVAVEGEAHAADGGGAGVGADVEVAGRQGGQVERRAAGQRVVAGDRLVGVGVDERERAHRLRGAGAGIRDGEGDGERRAGGAGGPRARVGRGGDAVAADRRRPGRVVARAVAGERIGRGAVGGIGAVAVEGEADAADGGRARVGADVEVARRQGGQIERRAAGQRIVARDRLVGVRVDQRERAYRLRGRAAGLGDREGDGERRAGGARGTGTAVGRDGEAVTADRRRPGIVVARAVARERIGQERLGGVVAVAVEGEADAADGGRAGVGADVEIARRQRREIERRAVGQRIVAGDRLVGVGVHQAQRGDRRPAAAASGVCDGEGHGERRAGGAGGARARVGRGGDAVAADRRRPGRVVARAVAGERIGRGVVGGVGAVAVEGEAHAADGGRARVGADVEVAGRQGGKIKRRAAGQRIVAGDRLVGVGVDQRERAYRLRGRAAAGRNDRVHHPRHDLLAVAGLGVGRVAVPDDDHVEAGDNDEEGLAVAPGVIGVGGNGGAEARLGPVGPPQMAIEPGGVGLHRKG